MMIMNKDFITASYYVKLINLTKERNRSQDALVCNVGSGWPLVLTAELLI